MTVLPIPQLFCLCVVRGVCRNSALCLLFNTLWVTNTEIVQGKKKCPNQCTVANAKSNLKSDHM
jgi:hypothetical protein